MKLDSRVQKLEARAEQTKGVLFIFREWDETEAQAKTRYCAENPRGKDPDDVGLLVTIIRWAAPKELAA